MFVMENYWYAPLLKVASTVVSLFCLISPYWIERWVATTETSNGNIDRIVDGLFVSCMNPYNLNNINCHIHHLSVPHLVSGILWGTGTVLLLLVNGLSLCMSTCMTRASCEGKYPLPPAVIMMVTAGGCFFGSILIQLIFIGKVIQETEDMYFTWGAYAAWVFVLVFIIALPKYCKVISPPCKNSVNIMYISVHHKSQLQLADV